MTTKIHVTKIGAAQRQLRAAIRMFFAGEDELAIHTVASAAYQIISDSKMKRGRDEVRDFYLTSIFYVIRDFHRGMLPKKFTDDPEAMKWIRELPEKFPFSESMQYEDLKCSVSEETARQWWQKRHKSSNFLKHADRDPEGILPLEYINNLELLSLALASYTDIIKDDLGTEGLVFWIYLNVVDKTVELLPEQFKKIANDLSKCGYDQQKKMCSMFIEKLKEN